MNNIMIKIKPGLHELSNYDVKPFLAGDIKKFNLKKEFKPIKKPVPEVNKKIIVSIPSRLTTTIIDTNDLSIKRPGGGMFGIGIDGFKTIIEIKLNKHSKKTIVKGINIPIVYHTLSLLSHLTKCNFEIQINIKKKTKSHIGLASNSALSLAASIGFNELLGNPFSNRQLRKILGYNYVENYSSKKVFFGLNVGTSQALGMYGGVILLTSEAEIVCHNYFPNEEKILVYIPKYNSKKKKISGINELKRVLNEVRILDNWQSQGRIYRIFTELIPKIRENDMKSIGNLINDFLIQGHQQGLLTNIYDISFLENIITFRNFGGNICGISSGGPAIFATGKKEVLIKIKNWLIRKRNASRKDIFIFEPSKGVIIQKDSKIKKRYKIFQLEK